MPRTLLLTVGGVNIFGYNSNSLLAFETGLNIDADGSPHAYSPTPGMGLDFLANAGTPGNWWAIVTENGKPTGKPVVQGPDDPAPGFYVSTTTLEDGTKATSDPGRYVDSETIPYIVLPHSHPELSQFKFGDIGYAYYRPLKTHTFFIFADAGPSNKIGEGSIKLAQSLGIRSDPKHGGASAGVVFFLFPGSGDGGVKTADEIQSTGEKMLSTVNTTDAFNDFTIV